MCARVAARARRTFAHEPVRRVAEANARARELGMVVSAFAREAQAVWRPSAAAAEAVTSDHRAALALRTLTQHASGW